MKTTIISGKPAKFSVFPRSLLLFAPLYGSSGNPSHMLLLLMTGFTIGMGGQMQPWFHMWSDHDFCALENSNTSPQQSKSCCWAWIGQINKKQNFLFNGCEPDYFLILQILCFSKQVFLFEWFLSTADSCLSVGKIHTDYILKQENRKIDFPPYKDKQFQAREDKGQHKGSTEHLATRSFCF